MCEGNDPIPGTTPGVNVPRPGKIPGVNVSRPSKMPGVNVLKEKNINLVDKEDPDFAVTSTQFHLSQNGVRSTVRARLGQNLARKASFPARPNVQSVHVRYEAFFKVLGC